MLGRQTPPKLGSGGTCDRMYQRPGIELACRETERFIRDTLSLAAGGMQRCRRFGW